MVLVIPMTPAVAFLLEQLRALILISCGRARAS